jgi:hypothetical protein
MLVRGHINGLGDDWWDDVSGGASGSSSSGAGGSSSGVTGGASSGNGGRWTGGAGGYDPFGNPWLSGITGGAGGGNSGGAGDSTGEALIQAARNAGIVAATVAANTFDPTGLLPALVEHVITGKDVSGQARAAIERSGSFIAKLALAFGIGYAAATALVIAGVGIFGIVLLKK